MKKHPTEGAYSRARSLRQNMTDAERKLWQILRYRQIANHKFRRQLPIGRFIVDFACLEAKLIIEADGGQHDLTSVAERERTQFLENQDYRILRFWNNEVFDNLDGIYRVIETALNNATLSSD